MVVSVELYHSTTLPIEFHIQLVQLSASFKNPYKIILESADTSYFYSCSLPQCCTCEELQQMAFLRAYLMHGETKMLINKRLSWQ